MSTGGVVSYSSSLYFVGANCKGTCFFGTLYICMERNLLFRTPHIICVFFKEMFLKFTKKNSPFGNSGRFFARWSRCNAEVYLCFAGDI